MRWTEEQLLEYSVKHKSRVKRPMPADLVVDVPDEGPESTLQGKIMKWAKDRGYPCQCFKQSRKAIGFLVPGWPD